MSNSNPVVFTVNVDVTREQLSNIIRVLNACELDDDDCELTIDNVIARPKLLAYLATSFVEGGQDDPGDLWNNNYFDDLRDYL